MARFIIEGRRRIGGTFRPLGNKNAVLPMLAASLLTDEPVTLRNVPDIADVRVMLELLASVGVDVDRAGDRVTLRAAALKRRRLDRELCRRVRSSILLAGPLAARSGRAVLFPPGGDVIGRRRLDTHFAGLRALGIEVEAGPLFTFRRRALRGADLVLDEASVTATENLLMAAALAPGRTTIYNAACEPHVQDLGCLLVRMGARIEGLGTNRLQIEGADRLRGAEHTVGPDFVEAGSFLAAAAVTRGELTVEDPPDGLTTAVMARAFERLGRRLDRSEGRLRLAAQPPPRVAADLSGAVPKIEDGPWPAFPSDLMSVAVVLATQSRGTVLFFEKMYESRMYFVDRLIEMGARIVQCDPHRVLVSGPSPLHGQVLTSPDIRAGMSLILAALCAKGRSVIENAQMIDRGYERIEERLNALGAEIVREE
jgi:UDP-N-acetylglucosamine 1-carboxyvinyltransferase